MNNQHITLNTLFVSERSVNVYAQIIAEEDIKETYGTKAILSERLYPATMQHIF